MVPFFKQCLQAALKKKPRRPRFKYPRGRPQIPGDLRVRVAPFLHFKVNDNIYKENTNPESNMAEVKKLGSTKRFGARYGRKPKKKLAKIEEELRKKQKCPYCLYLFK